MVSAMWSSPSTVKDPLRPRKTKMTVPGRRRGGGNAKRDEVTTVSIQLPSEWEIRKGSTWGYLDIKKMNLRVRLTEDEGISQEKTGDISGCPTYAVAKYRVSQVKECLLLAVAIGCVQCHATAQEGK